MAVRPCFRLSLVFGRRREGEDSQERKIERQSPLRLDSLFRISSPGYVGLSFLESIFPVNGSHWRNLERMAHAVSSVDLQAWVLSPNRPYVLVILLGNAPSNISARDTALEKIVLWSSRYLRRPWFYQSWIPVFQKLHKLAAARGHIHGLCLGRLKLPSPKRKFVWKYHPWKRISFLWKLI